MRGRIQASYGFELGMAFGDAFLDVSAGARISPQSTDRDEVQSAVGGTVTAAMEAMSSHFAG